MNGMSRIVKTVSSFAFPFVLIYGFYIIAHGHLTPGGGFQGGAVVASGCAMILVAYGSIWTMERIKEKDLSIFESLGAIGFIGLAFFGLIFGGYFFKNYILEKGFFFNEMAIGASNINTAGVIPLMNFAVGLKVMAGLFAIVLVMAYASSKKEEDK